MPERPDLRQISGSIRESLVSYEKEQLVEILTYVFKEYVVEGPPPLHVNQAERLEDLEDLSFAELIRGLQTRLDIPELALFHIDGDQVSVRLDGVKTPLRLEPTGRRAPTTEPEPDPTASRARPSGAGVQVVETSAPRQAPAPQPTRASADEAIARGRGDLAGMSRGAATPPAPRGGVSIASRPSTSSQTVAPSTATAADTPPSHPPEPDRSAAEGDGDDASIRFSLLEFD